jgi:hypothetical protein
MSAIAAWTAFSIWASSVMSATTKRAEPPAASIRRTVSFRVSSVRPVTVTRAPSAASARALARPMPLPPPVTSAVLPANC